MGRIVSVGSGTLRLNVQLGDVVSIHDDDVELTGAGYIGFNITEVKDMTAERIRELFDSRIPEIRPAWKLDAPQGELSFNQPVEQVVWKDETVGKWKLVAKQPKHAININNIPQDNIDKLAGMQATILEKETIIRSAQVNVIAFPENANEVEELNR